ncbi:MAG: hypothetical protein Q8P59_00995, partial [Dehalococcoidia bacterium]|nr:hypothetical protein [Dehalococcoidia bacterium]
MPEQGDRFPRDQEFHKDDEDRELYPKPDSDPDAYDIISPSLVTISSDSATPSFEVLPPSLVTIDWPSFDFTSKVFGEEATQAYLSYMLQGGPRTFLSSLETEREGYMACDYQFKTGSGTSAWDTWDYHGPLSVKVQSTFLYKPFKNTPEGIQAALQVCFYTGVYEETS